MWALLKPSPFGLRGQPSRSRVLGHGAEAETLPGVAQGNGSGLLGSLPGCHKLLARALGKGLSSLRCSCLLWCAQIGGCGYLPPGGERRRLPGFAREPPASTVAGSSPSLHGLGGRRDAWSLDPRQEQRLGSAP